MHPDIATALAYARIDDLHRSRPAPPRPAGRDTLRPPPTPCLVHRSRCHRPVARAGRDGHQAPPACTCLLSRLTVTGGERHVLPRPCLRLLLTRGEGGTTPLGWFGPRLQPTWR